MSRALSYPHKVKDETRKRVADAVAQTGYVVNSFASSLRSGRSSIITVFVSSLQNPHFAASMQGIVDALTKQYESNGRLISKSLYKNNADEASAFFEYETGLGAAKEHNAGIFMRVTPTLAAFMQIQARDGALAAEDSLKIHKMANPQLKTEEKK